MMKTALATAAVVLATPFAADPVGTKRSQMDFADDRENPRHYVAPYVGRVAGPLHQLLGLPFLSDREAAAAIELGYNPSAIMMVLSDSTDVVAKIVQDDGAIIVNDPEELNRVTGEVWAAFWDVDGNVADENSQLDASNTTLVRLI